MKVTHTTMNEVASIRGHGSEKGWGKRRRRKPCKSRLANKSDMKAKGMSKGVRGS